MRTAQLKTHFTSLTSSVEKVKLAPSLVAWQKILASTLIMAHFESLVPVTGLADWTGLGQVTTHSNKKRGLRKQQDSVPTKQEEEVVPEKRASGFRRVKKIDTMVFALGPDYKLRHLISLSNYTLPKGSFHLVVVMGCVHMEISWRNI